MLLAFASSSALADHVPPAGLDSKGTWAVLISVGVIFSLLILSFAWAYLDGQFTNPERIKYALTEPEREWPFENGTRRAHAPALGEHTRDVLAEHGYSAAEIAAMVESKVVAAAG